MGIEVVTRNGAYPFDEHDMLRISFLGVGGRGMTLGQFQRIMSDDEGWDRLIRLQQDMRLKELDAEKALIEREVMPDSEGFDEIVDEATEMTTVPSEPSLNEWCCVHDPEQHDSEGVCGTEGCGCGKPMIYQNAPRAELPPFTTHIEFAIPPEDRITVSTGPIAFTRTPQSGTSEGRSIEFDLPGAFFPPELFHGNGNDIPMSVPDDVLHPKVEHAARLARELLAGSSRGGGPFSPSRLDIAPKAGALTKVIEFLLVCDEMARENTSPATQAALIDDIRREIIEGNE